jgi:hypothetical protein
MLRFCNRDGEYYSKHSTSATAPENPEDLEVWLDTSGDVNSLKQYSQANDQWVAIATTYVRIDFPDTTTDLTRLFSPGEGVTLSGFYSGLSDFNNTMVLWGVGEKHIVVTGMLPTDYQYFDGGDYGPGIFIKKQMPNMDFVIESGNRLWGCRYGTARNGEVVNEIYASKLGDFKNWNTFASISTDSYVASVGTDGRFTGAINYLGYPIFFKENCMHKVYGNHPANYQIQTTPCRGVQKGCHKSLAIVNETLYYKSRSAICAYDGSLPREISSALGDVVYADAVAGALGNKYYISMRDVNETDEAKAYHLFVCDTQKGMWHREDNTRAIEFCSSDGELYYIDYATNQVKTVQGTGISDTKPIEWEATTGIIGTDAPDKKYISRILMRVLLEAGSHIYLQAQYDSSREWEPLYAMSATTLKTITIPVKPIRCDHLRLRLIGKGEAKIFSITKTIEQGSDI